MTAAAPRLATQTGLAPRTNIVRIVLASLVGTTIEFYDFYIYGLAAALVLGPMFFPKSAPETQSLNAFLTFGVAFVARPVGSLLFGHFGDRIGRKATLVASMMVMGVSTTLIGLLPGYDARRRRAGLLCMLRFGQGIGLGGEWGGAALIATENAPPGARAWFGMFPQLGPPIGFLHRQRPVPRLILTLGEHAFVAWGWRIPFLFSAVLVAIGLYLRVSIWRRRPSRRSCATSGASHCRSARCPRTTCRTAARHFRDRRLLRVVLHHDGVRAELRRRRSSTFPRTTFLAMLCAAAVSMAITSPIAACARRPVRPQAGVAGRQRARGRCRAALPRAARRRTATTLSSSACRSA